MNVLYIYMQMQGFSIGYKLLKLMKYFKLTENKLNVTIRYSR